MDKAVSRISGARNILEELQTDLQEFFDSHTEAWQESEKGEAAQEEMNFLEEAVSYLEDVEGSLDELDK